MRRIVGGHFQQGLPNTSGVGGHRRFAVQAVAGGYLEAAAPMEVNRIFVRGE